MKKLALLLVVVALMLIPVFAGGCNSAKQGSASKSAEKKQQAKKEAVSKPKARTVADFIAMSKEVEGVSAEVVISSADMSIRSRMWLDKNQKRAKSEMNVGQQVITYMDFEKMEFYSYIPAEKKAVKISLPENPNSASADQLANKTPSDFLEGLGKSAKIAGTERIDGVDCDIVEDVNQETGEKIKIWIRTDIGFPVKIESESLQGKFTIEYKYLKIGPQPADTFTLPEGTEIVNLEDMMDQIPGAGQPEGTDEQM